MRLSISSAQCCQLKFLYTGHWWDLRVRKVVERPSTPKTGSRVGQISLKLKIQNLSPNKRKLGEGENNTRACVWVAFGPVSRAVTWLQANDSLFLANDWYPTLWMSEKSYGEKPYVFIWA